MDDYQVSEVESDLKSLISKEINTNIEKFKIDGSTFLKKKYKKDNIYEIMSDFGAASINVGLTSRIKLPEKLEVFKNISKWKEN